jgi:hypothetical protein
MEEITRDNIKMNLKERRAGVMDCIVLAQDGY